jgi:hypothetical protein
MLTLHSSIMQIHSAPQRLRDGDKQTLFAVRAFA